MFPLSHTYISTEVTGRKSPLLILGSILPDISTVSSQQIKADKINNFPREFYEFVNTNYPQLLDLGLGVRLHSHVDGGADHYSDDEGVGYANIEGRKISEDVAKLLGVPNGKISLVLAHSFIEMAVDLHLYKNQREIWDIYKDSIEKIKTDPPKIAECVGMYLELEQSLVLKELTNLITVLSPYNFVSKEIATERCAIPLIKLAYHKDISVEETLKIADKALVITEPSYKKYLDKTVIEVKKNMLGN